MNVALEELLEEIACAGPVAVARRHQIDDVIPHSVFLWERVLDAFVEDRLSRLKRHRPDLPVGVALAATQERPRAVERAGRSRRSARWAWSSMRRLPDGAATMAQRAHSVKKDIDVAEREFSPSGSLRRRPAWHRRRLERLPIRVWKAKSGQERNVLVSIGRDAPPARLGTRHRREQQRLHRTSMIERRRAAARRACAGRSRRGP